MKLQAIQEKVYFDKVLNADVKEGDIINEAYEAKGIELTEAREKELLAAGVAKIVEDGPIVVSPENILNPEEVEEGDTVSVEAPEVIVEESKTEQTEADGTEVVTSTGEKEEELKGESVEAPKETKTKKNNKNNNVENQKAEVKTVEEEKAEQK